MEMGSEPPTGFFTIAAMASGTGWAWTREHIMHHIYIYIVYTYCMYCMCVYIYIYMFPHRIRTKAWRHDSALPLPIRRARTLAMSVLRVTGRRRTKRLESP